MLKTGLLSFIFLANTSFVYKSDLKKHHLESGINLTCFEQTKFGAEQKQTIDKIVREGYSTVVLNPIYYQETKNSNLIEQESNFDKKHLKDITEYCQDQGLDVVFKPMINSRDKTSRTHIFPENENEWFSNYDLLLGKITDLAIEQKIDAITVACELDSLMLSYPNKFNESIFKIREKGFRGKIITTMTYVNEEDQRKIKLMNNLDCDYVGVDFYVSSRNQELNENQKHFEYLYYLEKIFSESKKPVLIEEVGYRSVENGNKHPMFNYRLVGAFDEFIQEKSFSNFIKATTHNNIDEKEFVGIYFWTTDSKSYVEDILNRSEAGSLIGYSFFDKSAETVINKYNKDRIFFKYRREMEHLKNKLN